MHTEVPVASLKSFKRQNNMHWPVIFIILEHFLRVSKWFLFVLGCTMSIKSKILALADVYVLKICLRRRLMFLFVFTDRYDPKQAFKYT